MPCCSRALLVVVAIVMRAAAPSLIAVAVAGCSPSPDAPAPEVAKMQAFDDSMLRSALEHIVQWHDAHRTNAEAALRPGLREVELQSQLAKLPCRLPREIEAVYAWHDGTSPADVQFIWYHHFPSLENAIDSYRRFTATGLLHRDEFPVLEFEGEFYVVRCSSNVVDSSPVWHVHQNPERQVNYLSFTTYMETAAEWYETGAAAADDLQRLRAIHRRHNPGAVFPYAVD